MTCPTELRRARRTYVAVAAVVPLLLSALSVALMLAWLPDMPASIAVSWDAEGVADDFGPAWLTPLMIAGLGLLLAAMFGAIGLLGSRGGQWGPTNRFLGALALATSAFLLMLVTWSYGAQRGLSDAHASPDIGIALPVALGCAIIGGVVGWFSQPSVAVSRDTATEADPLPLEPGERAVWLHTATMAPPAMIAVIGAIALLAALAVVFAVTGTGMWMLMAGMAALLAVVAAAIFVFRVRVSEEGLRVASSVGVPRWIIPLIDVANVEVIDVSPLPQFGGWGIRIGLDGRFGIVLRTGTAIQVTRVDGRRFVVTVADAHTGASLLAALHRRSAAGEIA